MSSYMQGTTAFGRDFQDISRSQSFLSCDQENFKASKPVAVAKSRQVSESSCGPPGATSPAPLRVRNENIQTRSVSGAEIRLPVTGEPLLENNSAARRRASLRSLSSAGSASQEPICRLPLPPRDDPVLTQAVETSLRQARSNPMLSSLAQNAKTGGHGAFRRWIEALNKKTGRRRPLLPREQRWSLDEFDEDPLPEGSERQRRGQSNHRKSLSWASGSSALVAAVRSARQSLSTVSETPTFSTGRSRFVHGSLQESRQSHSRCRPSTDGSMGSGSFVDEGFRDRSVKRKQILDEILDSEECYVTDLKALLNVYGTLHGSAPELPQCSISRIQKNVNEILEVHTELLRELRLVPAYARSLHAENLLTPIDRKRGKDGCARADVDLASFSAANLPFSGRASREYANKKSAGAALIATNAREILCAATIFERTLDRFFVYEEYGATYENMLQMASTAAKSVPNWSMYQRGFEKLANMIAPEENRLTSDKKGLTLDDLLIKPIQRVCRYPLLFADLLKHMALVDGPEIHFKIEKVLFRLRETAAEINKATNDRIKQEVILRSWRLQDLLLLHDSAVLAPHALRSLGHAILCGALHVAYQSGKAVLGEYMLCALFKDCLVLACPVKIRESRSFQVVAVIQLADAKLERTDNAKGLQCHTAPFSWKLLFESDQQLYELVFSACNAREDSQWKTNLLSLSALHSQSFSEENNDYPERFSVLYLDVKPIGKVLGQPGSLMRQLSMQRAATVGSRPSLCQVIIKNTHCLKDRDEASRNQAEALGRSQSLLSTHHRIPILAPKRAERIRIEEDMEGVWTKETLPYPGMGWQHLDEHILASATSMLRKLSRTSLASTRSKRSTSLSHGDTGKGIGAQEQTLDPNAAADEAPYGLLPVIESPVGSVNGNPGNRSDLKTLRSSFAGPLKRSTSTISNIKRRVSEANLSIASKKENLGAQPPRSMWSTAKNRLGLAS